MKPFAHVTHDEYSVLQGLVARCAAVLFELHVAASLPPDALNITGFGTAICKITVVRELPAFSVLLVLYGPEVVTTRPTASESWAHPGPLHTAMGSPKDAFLRFFGGYHVSQYMRFGRYGCTTRVFGSGLPRLQNMCSKRRRRCRGQPP